MGLALLGRAPRRADPDVGTTTFRPPYTPVTLGAVAGHEQRPARRADPAYRRCTNGTRRTARASSTRALEAPHSYPRAGETEDDAANREARNVRTNVGVVDVSTLGKIELQGRDVVEFLDRVYVNRWHTLAVGRCRYGVMLRDDGIVMDDGTATRLAERTG